jgi:hypothetical protein
MPPATNKMIRCLCSVAAAIRVDGALCHVGLAVRNEVPCWTVGFADRMFGGSVASTGASLR